MINLWYEDKHLQGGMNGPLKVILNLEESLKEFKINYAVNDNLYEKNLLLHYDANGYKKHENLEHESCFIGPQFWPFDNYGQFLIDNPHYYNKLIVPSQWVKNLLNIKFGICEDKISIWPVGIKQSNLNKNIKYDCLIYSKRRSEEELAKVINFVESKKLSYNIVTYGFYQESDFELLSSQSKFCFLLNGSESQGIAVQEMMSDNTPLLVWDIKEWNDQGEDYKVFATSVPYWDDSCGEKFFNENEMEETFSKFYDKINFYTPQKFVEKNLSYERSVEILMEILNVN
jgi:hypothetical protein